MEKKIRIECRGAGTLALHLLNPLQGELKWLPDEEYERLRHEILEEGFSEPISIWENPADAKIYILNGHQRFLCLSRMKDDGYEIPQIPVNYVEARDEKQALSKLLGLASQYGRVKPEGLAALLRRAEITPEIFVKKFSFPEINVPDFVQQYLMNGPALELPKATPDALKHNVDPASMNLSVSNVRQVQLFYDGEKHREFMKMASHLQQVNSIDNLSDLIYEVLSEKYSSIEQAE